MAFPPFLSLLQPNLVLKDSILTLTPDILAQHQLKGLVLDVDDTIVSTQERDVSPELLQWLPDIKQVAQVCLLSNNLNRARIDRIARRLDLPYAFGAAKPSYRKLSPMVARMDLPLHQVAMVGDRLLTDVLAGNRLGVFTILVEPVMEASLLRRAEVAAFQILSSQMRKSSQ